MSDQIFFVTTMPASRPADYYLGYMEGSVFLDFNNNADNKVYLKRISFDGYGCYDLGEQSIPLNAEDSKAFKDVIQNDIKNQNVLLTIVKKAILLNKKLLREDVLKEYHLT